MLLLSTRSLRSLRSLLACSLSALAIGTGACGGGGDSPAPTGPSTPTPPASNTPTTVSVVAGDGQTGEAGARLPNALSVLVRNASGSPVSGVAVEFSVDSGGGSLAATTATTNGDGIATSGMWTLGRAGSNVVVARVGSLPVVRFRSIATGSTTRTLIDHAIVTSNGSTLVYRNNSDALDGLTITIPARSYSTSTTWTVTADSVSRPTLPSGFTQIGPTITIDNGAPHADSVLSVTMPTTAVAGDAVAPFYFDPATGYLEAIPITERSARMVGFATRHFSRDLLALPGIDPAASIVQGALLRTSASARAFGAVKIVWIKASKSDLAGTFSSGFTAGQDNWEFPNDGHFASPLGSCEGMSITALHYWYFLRRNGSPPLYHRYDKSLTDLLDNVQGQRYASAVQADYERYFEAHGNQVSRLIDEAKQRGTAAEDLTPSWIVLTLKLLKQPVLLAIHSANSAHAVLATAATYDPATAVTTVTFVDPNFPTQSRTMRFQGGTLVPVPLSTNAKNPQKLYTSAYALSVTAEIPLADVSKRWNEFTQKRAGGDRYPANYRIEFLNDLTEQWERLPDTLRTTSAEVALRHICASCKTPARGATTAGEQFLVMWDGDGAFSMGPNIIRNLSSGTAKHYAELRAYTDVEPAEVAQMDAKPFTVIYNPVEVIRPEGPSYVGTPETWRVEAGALAGPGVTYTWHSDDGAPDVTATTPTFTFTPRKPAYTNVTLTLKDRDGTIIARVRPRRFARLHLVLTPAGSLIQQNTPVTFTLSSPDYPIASLTNITVAWDVSGVERVEADTDRPSLTRTFTRTGAIKVTASLSLTARGNDDDLFPIGSIVEQSYTIGAIPPTWKFTSFNVQIDKRGANPWLDNRLIGSTIHFTRPETLFPQIQSGAKQGGFMLLERDSTFGTQGKPATLKPRGIYLVDTDQPLTADAVFRYLDVPPQGTTLNSSSAPQVRANWYANPVSPFRAADVALLDERYDFGGTITSGLLNATAWNFQFSTFKGNGLTLWFPFETRQINVTFGATTATGTITIISRDFDHSLEVLPRPETKRWTITATFTAERLR